MNQSYPDSPHWCFFSPKCGVIWKDFGLVFEIETIPFPDHLKSRYQEYTQANLTKLREAGYQNEFKSVAEGVAEYMQWLNRKA